MHRQKAYYCLYCGCSAHENLNFEEMTPQENKFSHVLCYSEEKHKFFINDGLHSCISNLPKKIQETASTIKCFNQHYMLVLLMKNRAVFKIAISTLQATSIFMLLFPKSVGKEESVIWEAPELSHWCRNFVTSICRSTVLMCLDSEKILTLFCNRGSVNYYLHELIFSIPSKEDILINNYFSCFLTLSIVQVCSNITFQICALYIHHKLKTSKDRKSVV